MLNKYSTLVVCILLGNIDVLAKNEITQARKSDIDNCTNIGIFGGSSGWGNLMAEVGIKNSKEEAMEKAQAAGATHIVWTQENRGYTTSVAGDGYDCNTKKINPSVNSKSENIINVPRRGREISSPAAIDNIAVLQLDSKKIDDESALTISDLLANNLQATGKFRVLERQKINEILKEQSFQESGACNTSECAVQIGKLLSLRKIVTGSIGQLGNSVIVNLRMIDVQSGEVLKISSRQVTGNIEDVPKIIGEMANDLSN